MLSIILTAYEGDYLDLRKMTQMLRNQRCKEFEVIPVVRGVGPEVTRLLDASHVYFTGEDAAEFKGNGERWVGLTRATGEYVCWVSADNLIYPNFVADHIWNFERGADVSIVNTDYWTKTDYCGVFPQALELRKVDLLNFALRRSVAEEVRAFHADLNTWESDWAVLSRAMVGRKVIWDRAVSTSAAHF